ncbi:MAG: type I-C CRISPR-associated protein Cas8c/Csd1, partial [Elusimicrobiaceae bacterium]|nr:type I-C CRISPR-associated protein Cas8c/Csd1 [Elusimicrobiaceae bacterium]
FRKHLKKFSALNPKFAHVRECLVRDILDDIDSTKGFPSQLSLEDRGLFALGYYQQMRAFFTKKTETGTSVDNQ